MYDIREVKQMTYTCPYGGRCGGCSLLGVEYSRQLEDKRRALAALLGGAVEPEAVVPAENPLHYRSRLNAAFTLARGRLTAGTYAAHSHRVVETPDCLIESEDCLETLSAVLAALRGFRLRPYDEDRGTGLLRHIQIRCGANTGEIMAVLVTAQGVLPAAKALAAAVRKNAPRVTTLIHNVNPRRTSMVLGGESRALFGPGYIHERIGGLTFRLSPGAFMQVNPEQTEKLYSIVRARSALREGDALLDAYCGVGTIGLYLAGDAGSVTGVELNRAAVRDARENARDNGIANARFVCADATEHLERAAASGGRGPDVIVLDPPRSGATQRFLNAAAALRPRSICYVSCNPETLARDLAALRRLGYKCSSVTPVDMFPMTEHLECVAALERI